ncbi:MAG: hypothetical protein ACLQU1_38205 [Bryobacteraceae bacterium]
MTSLAPRHSRFNSILWEPSGRSFEPVQNVVYVHASDLIAPFLPGARRFRAALTIQVILLWPGRPPCAKIVVRQTSGLMDDDWTGKGATLSDKTARKEYGLTEEEIIQAIRDGQLQYREHSIYGSPWLRLLRREVEALVRKNRGANHLKDQQTKTELASINRELRRLKTQMAALEERKSKLMARPGKSK